MCVRFKMRIYKRFNSINLEIKFHAVLKTNTNEITFLFQFIYFISFIVESSKKISSIL